MKIKKGFVKNNWATMAISLVAIALAIQSKDITIIILATAFVIAIIMRYRRYDEAEQEADDWWKKLTKEDKQKVKGINNDQNKHL